MADKSKINVSENFDEEILSKRKDVATRLEEMARRVADYRAVPIKEWTGTIPVVAAAVADAVLFHQQVHSDIGSMLSDDQVSAILNRSRVTFDHLHSVDPDTVRNAFNKAVGAAFEIDVQHGLQSGQIHAPLGTSAVHQYSYTNPGADFGFSGIKDHGDVLMNTKASTHYALIAKHFAEHPAVNYVYATHEAAVDAARHGFHVVDGLHGPIPLVDHPIVVDTGISAIGYHDSLADVAASHHHHLLGLIDMHGILENIPWITVGLLTYRAYRRHSKGISADENRAQSVRDVGRSGAAYGAAVLLQHAGVPVPVTVVGSMFSAAAVNGIFEVKDDWQYLGDYDEAIAGRLEAMAT